MKILVRLNVMVWFAAAVTIGCGGLMGPSDGEVMDAYEASISHFPEVTQNGQMHVENSYANGADLVMSNSDGSAYHKASIVVNDGLNRFYGRCMFTDYADPETGYVLNGEMYYDFYSPVNAGAEDFSGTLSCDVELEGGIVKTLEYEMERLENGDSKVNSFKANGKRISASRLNMVSVFRDLKRRLE